VESIVGHRPRSARSRETTSFYIIKWEWWTSWENTAEPASNIMVDVPHLVNAYWQAHGTQTTPTAPPAHPQVQAPHQAHCPHGKRLILKAKLGVNTNFRIPTCEQVNHLPLEVFRPPEVESRWGTKGGRNGGLEGRTIA